MDKTNDAETLRAILPFLKIKSKFLAEQAPRFIEVLDAFIANPSDVTGLRIYNPRSMAQDLEKDYELIDGFLSRLDRYKEEPENETL